ncbi:hypothetical protein HanPSC8_Chr01g0031561 [Helianthus annuus]|nr:hypothetical protein HanPSC8_Chr01g0031561 [Helianthus annuus]
MVTTRLVMVNHIRFAVLRVLSGSVQRSMSSDLGSYSVRIETDNESGQPSEMSPEPYGDHHGNPLISFEWPIVDNLSCSFSWIFILNLYSYVISRGISKRNQCEYTRTHFYF